MLLVARLLTLGRALYGLVLPAIMALGAYDRRRARHEREVARKPVSVDDLETPAPALPRLRRRQLRALVAQGDDPRAYDLRKAVLAGLNLAGIDLAGADLTSASLRKATLSQACLANAVLDHADLSACDLYQADLHGASLLEVDLSGADLSGADLSGCRHATMAHVRGARFDRHTRLPPNLDPLTAGAVRTNL